MLIQKIETFPLRIPLMPGSGPSDAGPWGDKSAGAIDSLLVKITTDDGLVGWGEAFGLGAVATAKRAIDHMIAPLCIGQDAAQIAALMLDVQKKLHVFGRNGPVMCGISAVDIALWDLAGKAANVPIHRLLGGSRKTRLPCYASLIRYSAPEFVRSNVRRAIDAGFHSLKLHEIDLRAIRAAREEAGPDIEIMLDVNCPWSLNEARAKAAELKEFGLRWLEEPLWPPENFAGLAELRRSGGIPIAAGENAATLIEFDHLMEAGAVDFVQPSPAKMGGITELARVFALAAAHSVTVMVHTFYDGPGLLAAIQTSAALGGAESMIEWRFLDLEAQLYGSALIPTEGHIPVLQGPGLGLNPEEDVIRTYTSAAD
jgi:L-alanine-DL-glutamate epimerase-like enolase superfamily enzyme